MKKQPLIDSQKIRKFVSQQYITQMLLTFIQIKLVNFFYNHLSLRKTQKNNESTIFS